MEVQSRGNSFSSNASGTHRQKDPNEVMNALRLDSLGTLGMQEQGELELHTPGGSSPTKV